LLGFLDSGREVKGRGVFVVGDDDVGELGNGGFSKGRESFFDVDKAGGFVDVLGYRGAGGCVRRLV